VYGNWIITKGKRRYGSKEKKHAINSRERKRIYMGLDGQTDMCVCVRTVSGTNQIAKSRNGISWEKKKKLPVG